MEEFIFCENGRSTPRSSQVMDLSTIKTVEQMILPTSRSHAQRSCSLNRMCSVHPPPERDLPSQRSDIWCLGCIALQIKKRASDRVQRSTSIMAPKKR